MNAEDDSNLELGRRGLAQSLKRVAGGAVGLDRSLFPLFTSGVGHERVLASFRAGITGAGGLPKVLSLSSGSVCKKRSNAERSFTIASKFPCRDHSL